jgi:hypothetical protein
MNILIDNKDLKAVYGIDCLDYSGALSFAAERENEIEWADKSGVDKNLANIRYEVKEFTLTCLVKATNDALAFGKIKTLVDYMFNKGCFVLSLRDTVLGIRECFLCERSSTIVGELNVRQQNSIYSFKLGLKDVNPNAVKYKNTIALLSTTINYTKGQTAVIYWGDGSIEEINNSGNYTKDDYALNGLVDIIVDIDNDVPTVIALQAIFSADITNGLKPLIVQFTEASTGGAVIWNWNFGDGTTSSEQNPIHIYTNAGSYTVSLQVFNSVQGSVVETKIDYITVNNSFLMVNDTDFLMINDTDKFLIN